MWWKNKRIYLDYAAGVAGNPSSAHEEGRMAKKMLEDARRDIARLVEVQADDVLFTSGATEANALAILGHVRAIRKSQRNNAHVLYLPSAHASIVENMKMLAEEGVIVEPLPIVDARVDTDALAKMITPNTVVVSMEAVCGETGVVWNTREVAQVLRAKNKVQPCTKPNKVEPCFSNVALHVDASQTPMTEKISRAHFDADMLTLDGSKVGARGIGALIAHRTIPIEPLYRGGGQERGMRPGTESPELAHEFARALRAAATGREKFVSTATKQRARLISAITEAMNVQHQVLHINEGRHQALNILNISLPGIDTDYLVALLDDANFAVSTRSACETNSAKGLDSGSRAVLALTGDQALAKCILRISWGADNLFRTTSRGLKRLPSALAQAVKLCEN